MRKLDVAALRAAYEGAGSARAGAGS
jgi:hypothetical protein